jgi:two-component system chemotaxis response regulator CheY
MDALKILVVDDSPIIVRDLIQLLHELDYKVVQTAANGRAAVNAYKACKPDVVTMDITMPDMDGIEATRLILSEYPNAKIVMVTSHGQEKMVLDALKAGARGYVLKPFQRHKLYQAIQKACNRVVLQEKLQSEIEQRTAQREAAEKTAAETAVKEADEQAKTAPEPGAEVPANVARSDVKDTSTATEKNR